jgi:predicted lipid-binding transport protein (Tim44 family)
MFLHVVSSDGTQDFPPALVATKQITIAQAPTPTPNPTPTITPNPANNQSGTNGSMPAIIGLGVLSVVLFIVGVILIATVASSPSPGDNRPGSGTRY